MGGRSHWRGAEGDEGLQRRQQRGEWGLNGRAKAWGEQTGWSSSVGPVLGFSPCCPPSLPASPQSDTFENVLSKPETLADPASCIAAAEAELMVPITQGNMKHKWIDHASMRQAEMGRTW